MEHQLFEYLMRMYNNTIKQTGFTKHYFLLYSIVEGLEAKDSFEFGTGISTRVILSALKKTQGKHISCDFRPINLTGLDDVFYEDNKENWTFLYGDSREEIKKVNKTFDFVLHDGSHDPNILEVDIKNILPKMKQNSILMVHDTVNIYNKELDFLLYNNELEIVLNDVLSKIKYEKITLPYGYGLTIVKIIEDFGNSKINTTWIKND